MKRQGYRTAVYRVRQFVSALRASRLSTQERTFVNQYLSPAQQVLFERMSVQDQSHAVAVARALYQQGWRDVALLQAALLHDIGKADSGLSLWHRVLIVLLHAIWPAGLTWLAQEDGGWRRPFYRHVHHPQIGARLAAEAGSSPSVVTFIAAHQTPVNGRLDPIEAPLIALQAADNDH